MDLDADRDVITIKNLHLPYGVIAPNVWGEGKAQPAVLSIELTLNPGIGSAADKDILDDNTVHYGHLAKRIRSAFSSDETLSNFLSAVEDTIYDMGRREDETFRLSESRIQLAFPKASMHGDKAEIRGRAVFNDDGTFSSRRTKVLIAGMKVMTLIGVNANERQAKQPLMVDLELCVDSRAIVSESDETVNVFWIENRLVEIIQDTTFETLESLAAHVLAKLQPTLIQMPYCSAVELRIDKPRAIPFAEAPGIIVTRRLKPTDR